MERERMSLTPTPPSLVLNFAFDDTRRPSLCHSLVTLRSRRVTSASSQQHVWQVCLSLSLFLSFSLLFPSFAPWQALRRCSSPTDA